MDRGSVEHLDEPAMNLCLYGLMCIFGIQYMYGKSSSSSLVSIPNEVREKGRDLTKSYDKSPYTHRKIQKQRDNTKRHQKLRLHNDCRLTYDGQLE